MTGRPRKENCGACDFPMSGENLGHKRRLNPRTKEPTLARYCRNCARRHSQEWRARNKKHVREYRLSWEENLKRRGLWDDYRETCRIKQRISAMEGRDGQAD